MLFIFRTPYMKKISTKYYNMFSFWNFDPLPKHWNFERVSFPFPSLIFLANCTDFGFAGLFFFVPVSLFIRLMISVAVVQLLFFFPFIFSLNIHQTQCISDYCKLFIIQNTKYSSFSSLYFLFFICSFHFLD